MNISFVIPAYNCQETFTETVESIFNGNFQPGDEVLIVDDCSTDNTAQIIAGLALEHRSIRLMSHRINKGTAAAGRNTAIEQAAHELVFCLDADNVLVPGSVARLKQYMLDNQADAAAFGEIHFFKEVAGEKKIVYKTIFKPGAFTLADALNTNYFIGQSGNYLFTKQSWIKAGRYFEPTLINQTLDSWTFTVRQLGTGAKLVKLPDTHYLHRRTDNSHWQREIKKGNVSLAALSGLMPFLDQIADEDVDYIFGPQTRHTWFDDLEKHPIRLKSGEASTGSAKIVEVNAHVKKLPLWKRLAAAVITELRRP